MSSKKPQNSFKEKVFAVVRKISRGKTLTYKQVANLAGSPGASRGVGSVLSTNYDPKIPCHRVLRSDGGLGGYNRGVKAKVAKLGSEGYTI